MSRPEVLDFRATFVLCVSSVLLSVMELQGQDLSALYINHETWPYEPWQLLTSCLLHAGWMHLAFNIYWTFRFGSIIEPVLGLVPTVGVFVLLGLTSSGAQWAFSGGGVGLSGIGYGLFGVLWALQRYHPGYRYVLDDSTSKLFIAWFFLCIIATEMGVMNIGNLAHGTGAVMGALIGVALSPLDGKRTVAAISLAVLTLMIALLSTVGRPYVNFSAGRIWELHVDALTAFESGDDALAAELLEQVIAIDDENVLAWHNVGVAYHNLGRDAEALQAIQRSEELERALPVEDEADSANSLPTDTLLEMFGESK